MKRCFKILLLLSAGGLLSSCKTSTPEFGFPDAPEKKGLKKIFDDDRSADWSEKRRNWAKRENEKFDQMFDRMRGDPYH